jgi:hypothetical protein
MAERNLFAVPLTIIFSDGTAWDAQIITLAEDEAAAKADAASWFSSARPWATNGSDNRQIQRCDFAEPEKLNEFYGFGLGTKPFFWETHK